MCGAEPRLLRKHSTQPTDAFHHSNNHSTLQNLLRDSPRLRHKLHLTPDYLPRTPTLATTNLNDQLPKKYRHRVPFKKRTYGESKRPKETLVELVEMTGNETTNLIMTRNGTFNGTTHQHENGLLSNGGSLPLNSSPRPL